MITIKKNFAENLLIFIPLFPLLDMFIFKDSPLLTICVYIVLLIMYGKKIKIYNNVILVFSFIFVVFLSSAISILSGNLDLKLLYYLLMILTFSAVGIAVGQDIDSFFDIFKKMVYFYAFLNTLIYISRMFMYSFDFSRVRGNMSIYGGNSAQFILFALLLLLKQEKSRDYIFFLIYSCIHSIMFVSKGAILISLIWIFLDIINLRKLNKAQIKYYLALFFMPLVLTKIINRKFSDYFFLRFQQLFDYVQAGGSIFSTRGKIFEFSVNYIVNNSHIMFFGIGPIVFRNINPWGYSNTHNLFMDILVDTGIFSLFIFFIMLSITFIKSKNRFYFLLCVFYALFEGVALFYTSYNIITGYAYMVLIVLFIKSTKIKLISNIN